MKVTPANFAKRTDGQNDDTCGDAPIWEAETPVGRFAFGCDLNGTWYWQGCQPFDLGSDVATREQAEAAAMAAYVAAVLAHPVAALLTDT